MPPDDVRDSFCEQMERVFDKFPKHTMKILLHFNAIFKQTTGNERLEQQKIIE
jgi:hypothetical protein